MAAVECRVPVPSLGEAEQQEIARRFARAGRPTRLHGRGTRCLRSDLAAGPVAGGPGLGGKHRLDGLEKRGGGHGPRQRTGRAGHRGGELHARRSVKSQRGRAWSPCGALPGLIDKDQTVSSLWEDNRGGRRALECRQLRDPQHPRYHPPHRHERRHHPGDGRGARLSRSAATPTTQNGQGPRAGTDQTQKPRPRHEPVIRMRTASGLRGSRLRADRLRV